MNVEQLNKNESGRLLLIFSGWASDGRFFTDLKADGYTILIISDYTEFKPETICLEHYKEICVIGWSFGVPHAAEFLSENPQLPVTLTIAVNGTVYPVDEFRGIPETIFNGTLNGLNERNLQKFYRRICSDSTTYNHILKFIKNKDIDALKQELAAIGNRSFKKAEQFQWDIAIVGENDRIIPPANQCRAWENNATTILTDNSHHLPDFQSIIDRHLINKPLVANRFSNATDSYSEHAVVQNEMSRILAGKMTAIIKTVPKEIIEFGAGNGEFTQRYFPSLNPHVSELKLWDIAAINPLLPGTHLITDAELQIKSEPDESVDIICGSATIQWFNNPLRFIRECHRVLRPGGLLVFSTFAPDNFPEITSHAGTLPLLSADKWKCELEKTGFECSIESEKRTVNFPDSHQLLKHLKMTGVNAIRTSNAPAVGAAKKILAGNIRSLTYSPLYIIASKV